MSKDVKKIELGKKEFYDLVSLKYSNELKSYSEVIRGLIDFYDENKEK